jgi:uncharacterized protein (DUF2235 family)
MKNIVVCCDGTGNEIGVNLSNVLKLYRMLKKNERQIAYYNPGVGTLGQRKTWGQISQNFKKVIGLATGYGLDNEVLDAYRFIAENYVKGDNVFLFGFSRGAYTVRVLTGFMHLIGLLRPDQLNYLGYAFTAYKQASTSGLEAAWHFRRVVGGRVASIKFLGVWDTVASVIVPRADRFYLPSLETLPYTLQNPSVEVFRHAMAIDEFRRMFRLCAWKETQEFKPNHFSTLPPAIQDARQVWFAGCHSDIGGGYPENESGLSKFPLRWMIDEARKHGLLAHTSMVNHLVDGKQRKGSTHEYAKPDSQAALHKSGGGAWGIVEWLPKREARVEWEGRKTGLGIYLPRFEPRPIAEGALIHRSVLERRTNLASYRPMNFPTTYQVES